MCDERDMTMLEAHFLTRPKYADNRRQAYAEWAREELYSEVMKELEKPPYYISGEPEISLQDIVDAYIGKMRYFRNIAKPGKKLMFQIAIREAESLNLLFSRKDEDETD
jgi:hypothetical protein